MKCPLCKNKNITLHKIITTAKITGSLLYDDIVTKQCVSCGHVFNELSLIDKENLKIYYKREYMENRFTSTKMNNDYFGIEYESNSLEITQNNLKAYTDLIIHLNGNGSYDLWPARDFIVLNQFLEHCWNIDGVMRYLRRALPTNGKIYISVPDYDRYDDNIYYFLIKEHVHHFNGNNIISLFNRYGFKALDMRDSELDIFGGKIQMPIIEFMFQNDKPAYVDGTYCYGASREFMYLLEKIDMGYITAIIDDTPGKIGRDINGIPIIDSSVISSLSKNSKIIIASYYSSNKIHDKLNVMGYGGNIEIMEFNQNV
jgi:hypothetical protein